MFIFNSLNNLIILISKFEIEPCFLVHLDKILFFSSFVYEFHLSDVNCLYSSVFHILSTP